VLTAVLLPAHPWLPEVPQLVGTRELPNSHTNGPDAKHPARYVDPVRRANQVRYACVFPVRNIHRNRKRIRVPDEIHQKSPLSVLVLSSDNVVPHIVPNPTPRKGSTVPELFFKVRWPDGSVERCYSPSLVVEDFFTTGESYALSEFLERSRRALTEASDRVRAKYGFGCSGAAAQLEQIERQAGRFAGLANARVSVEGFDRC
jgi:uncharacterized repeat protein (TIGR04042 family)